MTTYVVTFRVDGRKASVTIKAGSSSDARKLVEAQYPNCKVSVISCERVD